MLKKVFLHGIANFIAVLIVSAALHRLISTYFYISLLSLPISGLIAYCQFKFFFNKVNFGTKQVTNLVLTLFVGVTSLTSFSFHSTVPLNVDRSFSVWMINQLATSSTNNQVAQVENNAAKFFSPQGGEISRRVDEQIALGNIEENKGFISLTSRGKRIWHVNRLVAEFFGLNTKYAGD